jgi:hypothetical protein
MRNGLPWNRLGYCVGGIERGKRRALQDEQARDDVLGGFRTTVIAGLLRTLTIHLEGTPGAQGQSVQNCTLFKTTATWIGPEAPLTKFAAGRDGLHTTDPDQGVAATSASEASAMRLGWEPSSAGHPRRFMSYCVPIQIALSTNPRLSSQQNVVASRPARSPVHGGGNPPAHAVARSSSCSHSRALRVSTAARSNSVCASRKRPRLKEDRRARWARGGRN